MKTSRKGVGRRTVTTEASTFPSGLWGLSSINTTLDDTTVPVSTQSEEVSHSSCFRFGLGCCHRHQIDLYPDEVVGLGKLYLQCPTLLLRSVSVRLRDTIIIRDRDDPSRVILKVITR